jgi:hypothetical protein
MIRSSSIRPTRLFPARKSKLFRQRCREIPSEATSKTDSRELRESRRAGSARDSSAAVDRMRGWPKVPPAAVQAPPAYKEVGDWKPAQPNDQNLGGTWWTIFEDPQLDALELQVNVSNQNLKAAEAQFQQARAVLRYYRADYYPTVTAGPSATRTRVSANSPTGSPCGRHLQRFCAAVRRFLSGRRLGTSSKKRGVLSRASASECGGPGDGQSEHARGSGR